MIEFQYENIAVTGLMCCVPENTVRLDEIRDPEISEEFRSNLKEKTGVLVRHISPKEQTASDLAFVAAERLLNEKKINRASIGALVFVTESPDYRIPSIAYVLQTRLGLPRDCVCYDINLGCSGFVYGLNVVASMMNSSNIQNALLLTGDTISKFVNPKDFSVSLLVADSASAVLLQKGEGRFRSALASKGDKFRSVMIPAGAYRNIGAPAEAKRHKDGNIRSDYDLFMDGVDVFSFGISDVSRLVREFMQSAGKTPEDYDGFILHQATLLLMKQMARKAKFPMEKVPVSIDRYGNTGGTSIPLTMADAFGDTADQELSLLLCGFGVGLSMGIVDLKISTTDIFPVICSNEYYTERADKND